MVLLPRPGNLGATTAETFAFAILLGWGTRAAAFALVLGVLVADVLRRAAPEKVLFNLGQYVLVMVAAGAVYEALGGGTRSRPSSSRPSRSPPWCSSSATWSWFGVTSLANGRDFVAGLKHCLRVEARPYAMVSGMAPIMLVVAQAQVVLLPLLLLPLLAVCVSRGAVQSDEGRAAAEQAADQAKTMAAEKARLAEAQQALVERLRESDRLKDDLLAAVSHELRTPWPACWGRWPP